MFGRHTVTNVNCSVFEVVVVPVVVPVVGVFSRWRNHHFSTWYPNLIQISSCRCEQASALNRFAPILSMLKNRGILLYGIVYRSKLSLSPWTLMILEH